MSVEDFLKKNKVPFALLGLLGSIGGFVISFLDLKKAVKEKKKDKS